MDREPPRPSRPRLPSQSPRRQSCTRDTWDTTKLPKSEQIECWEHALNTSHVHFDVSVPHPAAGGFSAVTTRRKFGELALVDCAVDPCSGHRGPREVAIDPGWAGVLVVIAGRERVTQGGREVLLGPGDCIVWDGDVPVDFDVLEPLRKRTLLLPRDRVLGLGGRIPAHIPPVSAHSRLLAGYLDMLAAELDGLDAAASAAAANAALELVRAAIAPTDPRDLRALMLPEVCRWIEARLQDPNLTPTVIARANAVSVRTLHSLFEPTGETLGAFVRRRRLEHTRDELRARPELPVTTIACRWGFSSVSHFSRSFHSAFGRSPTEYRAATDIMTR